MQPTTIADKAATGKATRRERERIADGVVALMRYSWELDRGAGYLAAVEESGMTLPQLKALITLVGREEGPCPIKDLAESLGLAPPPPPGSSMRSWSGAWRPAARTPTTAGSGGSPTTASGRKFVEDFAHRRTAGLEALADRLTPSQRRKLVAAFDALLENDGFRRLYEANRRAVASEPIPAPDHGRRTAGGGPSGRCASRCS